jgi:spore coat protein U-like protein
MNGGILKYIATLGAILLIGGTNTQTQAAPITTTTKVSAQLAATCMLNATNIAFGNIVPGTSTNVNSSITVNCTKSTNYTITGSSNGAGMHGQAHGAQLCYGVNILATGGWLGINGISGTGTGSSQSYDLASHISNYCDINAPNIVPFITPDSYSDTFTTVVTF